MLWRPVANFNMVIRDLCRELRVICFSLYFSKYFSGCSLGYKLEEKGDYTQGDQLDFVLI